MHTSGDFYFSIFFSWKKKCHGKNVSEVGSVGSYSILFPTYTLGLPAAAGSIYLRNFTNDDIFTQPYLDHIIHSINRCAAAEEHQKDKIRCA